MTIRPLAASDLAPLRAVIDATGLFPGDLLDEMAAPHLRSEGPPELWLTTAEVTAIAYAAAERMTEGTWNLLLIAVHPDRQRQGTGAGLVSAVEARLREAGARLLLVETSGLDEFEPTRAFYRALGFMEEGRIRDYYKAGEDKIIFAKPLLQAAG
ncbi:GNAT family N-acetyltransferase [Falsiroseomonas tokyonensis]|uniref:GNAT family N-acetyltransferase n=1 Tax=Falsiroseomonas tokyonensis TaxID=430521 RepID=A0ABV7BYC8_9PROT|nr:GNAT family N-acetyltransferase [Falsiroseomonas tokyonensis]MBU8539871.1 GNAT family N-acetyltransferase [Falsiroseomonas tokyonensis]